MDWFAGNHLRKPYRKPIKLAAMGDMSLDVCALGKKI